MYYFDKDYLYHYYSSYSMVEFEIFSILCELLGLSLGFMMIKIHPGQMILIFGLKGRANS